MLSAIRDRDWPPRLLSGEIIALNIIPLVVANFNRTLTFDDRLDVGITGYVPVAAALGAWLAAGKAPLLVRQVTTLVAMFLLAASLLFSAAAVPDFRMVSPAMATLMLPVAVAVAGCDLVDRWRAGGRPGRFSIRSLMYWAVFLAVLLTGLRWWVGADRYILSALMRASSVAILGTVLFVPSVIVLSVTRRHKSRILWHSAAVSLGVPIWAAWYTWNFPARTSSQTLMVGTYMVALFIANLWLIGWPEAPKAKP